MRASKPSRGSSRTGTDTPAPGGVAEQQSSSVGRLRAEGTLTGQLQC